MGPKIVALTYQDGLPQFQRHNYILDHQDFYQAQYGYVQAQKGLFLARAGCSSPGALNSAYN
jgi:hypothetical protein